jgi:hypothetical protein
MILLYARITGRAASKIVRNEGVAAALTTQKTAALPAAIA